MLKRTTLGFVKSILMTLAKVVLGRLSWRFVPATIAYYYKRNIYDLRLLTSASFRQAVEIDDWLANDLLMIL